MESVSIQTVKGELFIGEKERITAIRAVKNNTNMHTKQLGTHNFADVYKKLGININTLGCVMLDIKKGEIENLLDEEELYYSPSKEMFWIKGFVAGKVPHLTLLYGLMKSGTLYEPYIKKVLTGWKMKTVTIDEVSYFDSTYEKEPYYCIVAKAKVTPALREGHERLQFLPHIDTFAGYKPHVTIAYIKKDRKLRDRIIKDYAESLEGKKLSVTGINLGGEKG